MKNDFFSERNIDASVYQAGADFIREDSLAPLLKTAVLGRDIYALGECESTMVFARRLVEAARENATKRPRNGALVTADLQRGGRGRNGKVWEAERGSSLLLSLILYPSPERGGAKARVPATPNLLTMGAALAVVRALRGAGAEGCSIKWPNDVLDPQGRKLCGILTESVGAREGAAPTLITGVGLNVHQTEEDFPQELRQKASSVRIVAGRRVSRLLLLKAFLEEFEACLSLEDEILFRDWGRNCSTLGRMVRVQLPGREIVGQAIGVENDGALQVRLESGIMELLRSGDVEELRLKP